MHTPSPEHVPHPHDAEHDCVPHRPHGCVAPALHVPVPEHVPHAQLAVHVCQPHVPHGGFAPGSHAPSPEQAPHVHVSVHVCIPQFPHGCDAPGVHSLAGSVSQPPGTSSTATVSSTDTLSTNGMSSSMTVP